MSHAPLADAALALGSTMRLTRLVLLDDLGLWLIRQPAFDLAKRHDPEGETWVGKAHSGLDCTFCVGYWIGAGVALAYLPKRTRPLWRFVTATLTLNEVSGHLGARLGDTG